MTFTAHGKEQVASILGSSDVAVPTHIAIGTGSGTATVTNTALATEADRNVIGSPIDVANRFTTWSANFSSTEMSGLALTEFGLFNIVSGGCLWLREAFGSQAFDGTEELQADVEVEVF